MQHFDSFQSSTGWSFCIKPTPVWWQANIVECGVFILLVAVAIFVLVAASRLPYWSKTDRLWKAEQESPDDQSTQQN